MSDLRSIRLKTGAFLALFLAAGAAWAADPRPGADVTPAQQIEFEQQKAAAHMQELEERMFRLAEVIRELEPDDSARLLLAVQKAREGLIIEQMRDALALVGRADLGQAVHEQRAVLSKLEELRQLLLSTDLDFRIKLERLRKIEQALQKLEAVTREEMRQRDQSGAMARQHEAKPLEQREFDAHRQDQQRNRQATEAIQQTVRELGESVAKAGEALGGAAGAMAAAEGSLGGGNAGGAQGEQDKAVQELRKAREELERERQELLEELKQMVARQVMANLQEMLERQKAVREATAALVPKVDAGDREAVLGVQRLAEPEQRLVDITGQTIDLIVETQFSVALPPALEQIQRRMVYVTADLKAGRGTSQTVAAEQQIEDDIAALIEAMKPMSSSAQGGQGQCKSCNGNKNTILAELKIIRLLQVRVNEETIDADGRRAQAEAELDAETRAAIGSVRDSQTHVRDAMDRLHHATCPHCLEEE